MGRLRTYMNAIKGSEKKGPSRPLAYVSLSKESVGGEGAPLILMHKMCQGSENSQRCSL